MQNDEKIILSGDIVGLNVDSSGLLSMPSPSEPVPEKEEKISHLRVTATTNVLESDFSRCMFRLDSDVGQGAPLLFGTVVKIIHIPSEFMLVASKDVDDGYTISELQSIYLHSGSSGVGDLSHKWVIIPRYNLREEGDPIRSNDYVILRNAQHKHLCISSFKIASTSGKFEDLIGLSKVQESQSKPGIQLMLFAKGKKPVNKSNKKQVVQDEDDLFIKSGEYVRVMHREYQGHLICRVDDNEAFQSVVTPLGSVCRRQLQIKDHAYSLFLRSFAAQKPNEQYDFPTSNSSLGVWQIVSSEQFSESVLHGKIKFQCPIRLRHVISGQYLAIRPVTAEDNSIIQANTFDIPKVLLQRIGSQKVITTADLDSSFVIPPVQLEHKVNVVQVIAKGWQGKHDIYLLLSYGNNKWSFRSNTVSPKGSNIINWQFEKEDERTEFKATHTEIQNSVFKISVMEQHTFFKDKQIGSGESCLFTEAYTTDNESFVEYNIAFCDTTNRVLGTLVLIVSKETTSKTSLASASVELGQTPKKNPIHNVKTKGFEKWAFATVSQPTENTLFELSPVDIADDQSEYVKYNERVIWEHSATKLRLQLSELLQKANTVVSASSSVSAQKTKPWWEYKSDCPLVPTRHTERSIIDKEVCQIERVNLNEVQDILFSKRFIPLIHASTTALQLTPKANQLYLPMYRHFCNALQTLVLWILGAVDNEPTLLDQSMNKLKKRVEWSMKDLVDDLAGDGEEHHGRHNDSDHDSDDASVVDDEDGNNNNENGISMMSLSKSLSKSGRTRKSTSYKTLENGSDEKEEEDSKEGRLSAMAPWLDRELAEGFESMITTTALDNFSSQRLKDFVERELPTNEKVIRRQGIIAETRVLEHLLHFLNIFFVLQRSIQLSSGESIIDHYPSIPLIIRQCCFHIQNVVHCCVYQNQKIALKIISLNGSFTSMISQKILGWNPPIEAILRLACKDSHKSKKKDDEFIDIEAVFINSIKASDIRQIIEQMHFLHLNGDIAALNIMQLLTLLCSAGAAKKYFQDLLIHALANCENHHEHGDKDGTADCRDIPHDVDNDNDDIDYAQTSSIQRDCMLFHTRHNNGQWQIKLKSKYSFPSQEEKNKLHLDEILLTETLSLKNLFNQYNSTTEESDESEEHLDINECFCLLEDLALAGPFLYQEIRYLEGSSMWGFLHWWCWRSGFFFPSSSISHCQLSPVQAYALMGYELKDENIQYNNSRIPLELRIIMKSLNFFEIINSKFAGLSFNFKTDTEGSNIRSSMKAMTRLGKQKTMRKRTQTRDGGNTDDASSYEFTATKGYATTVTTQQKWMSVAHSLSDDFNDNNWFRHSLILLNEICMDRNIFAQRITSRIVPAECLMEALNDGDINKLDRHILCNLLCSVYVDHDYVFPTKLIPTFTESPYCGYNESINDSTTRIGKVFNTLSRVKLTGDAAESGASLRNSLFRFMKQELGDLSLYSKSKMSTLYTTSILNLLQLLIEKGFFNEPTFEFVEYDSELNGISEKFSMTFDSHGATAISKFFNIDTLQQLLIDKLHDVIELQKNSNQSVQPSPSSDNLNESTKDTGEDTPGGKSSKSAMTWKSKSFKRKTMATMSSVFAAFDLVYSDMKYSNIIAKTIRILTHIHDMKQLLRLQSIWNYICDTTQELSLHVYSVKYSDLVALLNGTHTTKFVHTMFEEASMAVDPRYCEAIFTGTLYTDNDLQKACYDLINRVLCMNKDALSMFNRIHCTKYAAHALTFRLIAANEVNLLKYAHEIALHPFPTKLHLLERLDLALENIKNLCFNHDLSKPKEEAQALSSRSGDDFDGSMKRKKSTVFKQSSENKLQDERAYLRQIHFYTPIPCPSGQDDFFDLELVNLLADEPKVIKLAEHFSIENQFGQYDFKEATAIDCMLVFPSMFQKLFGLIADISKNSARFWNDFFSTEKYVIDQVLLFMASVAHNCVELCNEVFEKIAAIMPYYPESKGCVKLVNVLLTYCGEEKNSSYSHDSLLSDILQRIDDFSTFNNYIVSSVISSALKSSNAASINIAVKFLFARMEQIIDYYDFTNPVECLNNSYANRSALYHAIYPISLLFELQLELSEEEIAAVRAHIPYFVCDHFLNSDCTPYRIKSCFLQIAMRLYTFQEIRAEDTICNDLRKWRFYLNLNLDNEHLTNIRYCREYITSGAISCLRARIESCEVLTTPQVNLFIIQNLIELENKHFSYNAIVTKRVFDDLKTFFLDGVTIEEGENQEGYPDSNINDVVVRCLMLMLNVLVLKDGYLWQMLSADEMKNLVWVCAACYQLITTRCESIIDSIQMRPIDPEDVREVIPRLKSFLHGLLLEYIAKATENFLNGYFASNLINFCQTVMNEAKTKVAAVTIVEDALHFLSSNTEKERELFKDDMKLASSYTASFIKQTPVFHFLRESLESASKFYDLGGALLFGDQKSPQIRSKTFTQKFTAYSDIDLWLHGDGKYIINLFLYLGHVTEPTLTEYNLIHLLSGLLENNIDEIRASNLIGLNIKMKLIELETDRLRKVQDTLNQLGLLNYILKTLGRSYSQASPAFLWLYAPLSLKLCNETIAWQNKHLQDAIIDQMTTSIQQSKPPEYNCMLGLQFMIRKCITELSSSGDILGKETSSPTSVLKSITQLFSFVGTICLGDNEKSQRFFAAVDAKSKHIVNIMQELCILADALLTKFSSIITYIQYDQFNEKLAPLIWAPKDGSKRRFLAWHDPNMQDLLLVTQYLHTIGGMYDNLISMCCVASSANMLQALTKCPNVLEFLGLMQLKATATISSVQGSSKKVHWRGGNPFSFYKLYVYELSQLGLLEQDPDFGMLRETLVEWQKTLNAKRLKNNKNPDAAPLLSAGSSESKKGFKAIFGISQGLFLDYVRRTEYKCLRTILSFMEFSSNQQARELLSLFNDGILIQNMNNIFVQIGWASGSLKDTYSSTTVAYISLIESVGIQFPETDQLLANWDEDCTENGYYPKSIFGSVEIVTPDGRVQRLYFPVPSFVKTYWPYPEVQKTKNAIVFEVNRDSPEEKIADFLDQMARVSVVMKRQERLKNLLTFPIHALFGGKTTSLSGYFPTQRVVCLYIIALLNIHYMYINYIEENPNSYAGSGAIKSYTDWDHKKYFLNIVGWVVFSLNGSLLTRTVLNSSALDDLPQIMDDDNTLGKIVNGVVGVTVGSVYLFLDTIWPLCLTGFSYLALMGYVYFYVPCLLDVMFLVKDMYFLYEAISRNVSRIGYTLLLSFLCLYFFAVLTFLFAKDQYNLGGHLSCNRDLVECFKLHLDYGLYNAPDWSTEGYIAPDLSFKFIYGKLAAGILGTIYNLTYVIIINLVLQAIISGLIIDTFSSMREENERILEDISDKCFICSIGRDDFEQAGISFTTHIKEEHNMWHYAWFKIYLELKDPLSYSSSENYAFHCMQDRQTFLKMMPLKKSLSLQKKLGGTEEAEQTDEKLEQLKGLLADLSTSQTSLASNIQHVRRSQDILEDKFNATRQNKGRDDDDDDDDNDDDNDAEGIETEFETTTGFLGK